jgi:hypothetical protein
MCVGDAPPQALKLARQMVPAHLRTAMERLDCSGAPPCARCPYPPALFAHARATSTRLPPCFPPLLLARPRPRTPLRVRALTPVPRLACAQLRGPAALLSGHAGSPQRAAHQEQSGRSSHRLPSGQPRRRGPAAGAVCHARPPGSPRGTWRGASGATGGASWGPAWCRPRRRAQHGARCRRPLWERPQLVLTRRPVSAHPPRWARPQYGSCTVVSATPVCCSVLTRCGFRVSMPA